MEEHNAPRPNVPCGSHTNHSIPKTTTSQERRYYPVRVIKNGSPYDFDNHY